MTTFWYLRITKLANDWYAKIHKVTIDWHDRIRSLTVDGWANLRKVYIDWFAYIKNVAVDWRDRIRSMVVEGWANLRKVYVDWFANIKNVAVDWHPRIKSLAVDGWANLRKVYIDWFDGIRNVAVDWHPRIKKTAVDWYNRTRKLVIDYFTGIVKTAADWIVNTEKIVVDWFKPLSDYAVPWRPALDAYVNRYLEPAMNFFTDPAGVIFSVIEAYVYGWGEWFLAVLLGGIGIETPERPNIGAGIAPWIDFPPGPGAGASGLIWPSNARRISGYRFTPPSHNGLDIGTPLGSPIWSIRAGTVTGIFHSNTGYGNRVEIAHTGGYWSRYAHLSQISVWKGQSIGQGQTLGLAGSTGNSSGPHLHIEIRYNGQYINPETNMR